MTKNLVAKNGTVVHAPAATADKPVLCSTMWRDHRATWESAEAKFSPVDAPVTCKDCCRILGIDAPKTLAGAKRTKPALDAFKVGMVVNTKLGRGTIVKLTNSMVTYTVEGIKGNMAAKRDSLRKLNG